MSATHLGFYNTSSSRTHVRFNFSTHAAAGGNVAPLSGFEAADLKVYKATDGAAFSATERSSASGITMTSPFDSLTGFHSVDIDLTDNTDAGFWATGCMYMVVLAPDTETVDSQTITAVVLAYFEIGLRTSNVVQVNGTNQTARDIGASVLLSSGTGTGQLDFTSGVVKANLAQILGTALTETAGQIAAAFKKFFDIASPTSTMNRITLVDTTTTNTDMRGTDNAATAAALTTHDGKLDTLTTTVGAAGAGLTEAGGTGDQLTAIPWNAAWDAEVQSEAADALVAYDPPTKAELDTAESNIRGADSDTLKTLSDQLDGKSTFNPTADEVESGVNWKQALQRIGATTAGKASGAGSGTETFKGLDGTTDRVEATVDNDGNRTGVTYDP